MDEKRMALTGHLVDLRKTIVWIVIAVAIGFAIGCWKYDLIIDWMVKAIPTEQLAFYSPTEGFMVQLKIGLFTGVILGFPAICAALAWFIFPGLTRQERIWMPILLLGAIALFFIGCLVVIFAALPSVLKFLFFVTSDSMVPMISLSKYLAFALTMCLAGGLMMLIPYVILFIIVTGIVPADVIAKKRIWVIVTIISMGLVLSYGLDLFTMVILFVPAYLLFELALFLGRKWRNYIERNNNVGGEVQ